MTNLEFYLNQPWTISIYHSDDPQEPWVARVMDVFSCYATATTPEQALHELKTEVLPLWVQNTLKAGNTISVPVQEADCKGKIAYRTTPKKHHDLLRFANRIGKSLNKVLDEAVSLYLNERA